MRLRPRRPLLVATFGFLPPFFLLTAGGLVTAGTIFALGSRSIRALSAKPQPVVRESAET